MKGKDAWWRSMKQRNRVKEGVWVGWFLKSGGILPREMANIDILVTILSNSPLCVSIGVCICVRKIHIKIHIDIHIYAQNADIKNTYC